MYKRDGCTWLASTLASWYRLVQPMSRDHQSIYNLNCASFFGVGQYLTLHIRRDRLMVKFYETDT